MINKDNYKQHTDKYFLRCKEILEKEKINPYVRYQVFAREDVNGLRRIRQAIDFIRDVVGDKVVIYSLKDGDKYLAGSPIMKIEGFVQDLIDLETVYLGIISAGLSEACGKRIDYNEMQEQADRIRDAAEDKKLLYMGARHFYPAWDEGISKLCYRAHWDGAATDIAAKHWGLEGFGTIPHSFILAIAAEMLTLNTYTNPTRRAALLFDQHMDGSIPRVVLCDTFNKEVEDSLEAIKTSKVDAIRVDTCGENRIQFSENVIIPLRFPSSKYDYGNGVTIDGVVALRYLLPEHVEIVVSSGFNEDKTRAFVEADSKFKRIFGLPLFTTIGSGSIGNPVIATSDIVAFRNFNSPKLTEWVPCSKVGRGERELNSARLVRQ